MSTASKEIPKKRTFTRMRVYIEFLRFKSFSNITKKKGSEKERQGNYDEY